MSERITWSMNVQVAGGPKFSHSRTREVEAFGTISVDLAANEGSATVQVPAEVEGGVGFLLISASSYGDGRRYALVETADDVVAEDDFVTLDAPQMLIGTGALSLLPRVPQLMRFRNTTEAMVEFTLLVGGAEVVD